MSKKLTPKQALFISEYLIDGNATRAAIAAGAPAAGAHVAGARWLKGDKVAAAIAEAHGRRAAKLEVNAERVLAELAKLAFYDPADLFDEKGRLLPITRLDDISRAAIAGIEVETRERGGSPSVLSKVKLADKGLNLERLGRYLKMFTDKVEHNGRFTLEQLVTGEQHGGSATEAGESAHS